MEVIHTAQWKRAFLDAQHERAFRETELLGHLALYIAKVGRLKERVQEVELGADWYINKTLELEMDHDDWRKELRNR